VSAKVRVLYLFSGDLWAGAEVMVANLLEQLGDELGSNRSPWA
jgi:hypothetical protein